MGQNLRVQALEDVPEIWAKPADVSEASAMRSGSVDLMTTSNAAIEMLPSSARRWASIRRSRARSSATVCSICCLAQAQHPPELFERRFLVEQLADLIEANSVYAWQG
jgi:head-tail adaptor